MTLTLVVIFESGEVKRCPVRTSDQHDRSYVGGLATAWRQVGAVRIWEEWS